MINTLLIFDEKDEKLGEFISECEQNLINFFVKHRIEPDIINSINLNDLTIELKINNYNNQNFVCAAYSHGETDCLLKSGLYSYLSINNEVINKLKNSFFYTFSCKTGAVFGKKIIEKGCLFYIGYKTEAEVWHLSKQDLLPFVDCANYGLKLFFKGEKSFDIISKMKNKYDEYIDKLYLSNMFIAEKLMINRDALIDYGKNISIIDMKKHNNTNLNLKQNL